MLAVNLDIQNRLINSKKGNISKIKFAQASVPKVYAKFCDEQAGLKAIRSYLDKQNPWVPIEKCEAEILIKNGSASQSIKRTQFPLILACASTVHKVEGLSLEQVFIDFDLQK